MQTTLAFFNEPPVLRFPRAEVAVVPGLQYLPDFISEKEHTSLLSTIDRQVWLNDLRRRVQHYGFKYDYKARRIDASMRLGELPGWLMPLAIRLWEARYFDEVPDQVIVNEYEPGQGITSHVDCEPCFDGTLVSISLGSHCVMDFMNVETKEKQPMLLAPKSAVVLKGDSRYCWTHGIAARKSDTYQGKHFLRQRRVSLTFRKTIL